MNRLPSSLSRNIGKGLTLSYKALYTYLRSPTVCPICRSENIETTGPLSTEDYTTTQEVKCNNCEATWINYYEVTGIVDLKYNGEEVEVIQ
jgi:transposase-like protein